METAEDIPGVSSVEEQSKEQAESTAFPGHEIQPHPQVVSAPLAEPEVVGDISTMSTSGDTEPSFGQLSGLSSIGAVGDSRSGATKDQETSNDVVEDLMTSKNSAESNAVKENQSAAVDTSASVIPSGSSEESLPPPLISSATPSEYHSGGSCVTVLARGKHSLPTNPPGRRASDMQTRFEARSGLPDPNPPPLPDDIPKRETEFEGMILGGFVTSCNQESGVFTLHILSHSDVVLLDFVQHFLARMIRYGHPSPNPQVFMEKVDMVEYRCRVVGVSDDNKDLCRVLLVDYGDVVELPKPRMPLPVEVLTIPPLAVRVNLSKLPEDVQKGSCVNVRLNSKIEDFEGWFGELVQN